MLCLDVSFFLDEKRHELRVVGPAFAGWRFVLCLLDEIRNIADLPRLSYSLGIQRGAPVLRSLQSSNAGYRRAGIGEYFSDTFFLFLFPLINLLGNCPWAD